MTRVRTFRFGSVLLVCLALAPPAALAQTTKRKAAESADLIQTLGIQGFSVVLVVGDMQAGDGGTPVPEATRKALADMRGFLPYKRYQLLDAAWMLCCAPQRFGASISGRVRGPDDRDYTYTIDPIGIADAKLTLRFTMRETRTAAAVPIDPSKLSDAARLEHTRLRAEAVRERDDAETQVQRRTKLYEVGLVSTPDMEAAKTRLERAQARLLDLDAMLGGSARPAGAGGASVMDSTFSIAPNETVVIGTSRLNGDHALIALLTAATRPGGSRQP